MTLDVSDALPYGPLERIEVYFEHDGPRFFALRSPSLDLRLLAFCTDEDEDTVEYLYLVLTPRRFNDVRSGHVGLREAFASAGPWTIWRVVERYDLDNPRAEAQTIRFQEIPEIDLPSASARLELPTPTVPGLDLAELSGQASSSLRTFAAVELDAYGENLTEFPLRGLGQIGTKLQDAVDALAQEVDGSPTERGPIASSVTEDVQMNVVALRAASFAVVLATDKRGTFWDKAAKVEATLSRLIDLVERGHQPPELISSLREYGPRARSKVIALLRSVMQANSGLGVVMSPREGTSTYTRLSAVEVSEAVNLIDEVQPIVNEVHIRRGILLGSNTKRSTFVLQDAATMQEYQGGVRETARDQIDGLRVGHSSFVEADLLETVDFGMTEQEGGRTYILVQIGEWTGATGSIEFPRPPDAGHNTNE